MTKPDTTQLPKIAEEYIDSVIKNMRYRKKIRMKVKQELTDHFIDALRDCQTEQQTQQTAEGLIAEFGDARLLGVLLKRAKKRCRSLWQKITLRTFQCATAIFILLIIYIGWFLTGKPAVTTDYLAILNQQAHPIADESSNARRYYKEAIEKLKYSEDESFDSSDIRNLTKLSEQERQFLQKLLSDNQESLELVKLGNKKPYYWPNYQTGTNSTRLLEVLLPDLSEFRKLARLLSWQAYSQAYHGDYAKAFDSALEGYLLGEHVQNNNVLVEQLVGIDIESLSVKTMITLLDANLQGVDTPLLYAVRNRFEDIISGQDFIIDFGAEKLVLYDEIQRSFTQDQISSGHLCLQRNNWFSFMTSDIICHTFLQRLHVLFTHPNRKETIDSVNRFYDEMDSLTQKSPATMEKENINTNQKAEEITKNNLFLGLLMPSISKVTNLSHRNHINSQSSLIILAILQYQKQNNGTLPETLDILVEKGLIKDVPLDPFSDKPLIYRKTNDGFMLYSVGLNFTDDGGVWGTGSKGQKRQWADNGDMVFWPIESDL